MCGVVVVLNIPQRAMCERPGSQGGLRETAELVGSLGCWGEYPARTGEPALQHPTSALSVWCGSVLPHGDAMMTSLFPCPDSRASRPIDQCWAGTSHVPSGSKSSSACIKVIVSHYSNTEQTSLTLVPTVFLSTCGRVLGLLAWLTGSKQDSTCLMSLLCLHHWL